MIGNLNGATMKSRIVVLLFLLLAVSGCQSQRARAWADKLKDFMGMEVDRYDEEAVIAASIRQRRPLLTRTADGYHVLELGRNEFDFDVVLGAFRLGGRETATSLVLDEQARRAVVVQRDTSLEEHLATADAWVEQIVYELKSSPGYFVPGEVVVSTLHERAVADLGLDLGSGSAALEMANLPTHQLDQTGRGTRLIIGFGAILGGTALIASAIAVTVTGAAVVVAPPLIVAGSTLCAIGGGLILSVVYEDTQRLQFEKDLEVIKRLVRAARLLQPTEERYNLALFDPQGFGYANSLILPGPIDRVVPLGSEGVLCQDLNGVLHLISFDGPTARRLAGRHGPIRFAAVADDRIHLGIEERQLVTFDRDSGAELSSWLLPATLTHHRVAGREFSERFGIVARTFDNALHRIDLAAQSVTRWGIPAHRVERMNFDSDVFLVSWANGIVAEIEPESGRVAAMTARLEGWKRPDRTRFELRAKVERGSLDRASIFASPFIERHVVNENSN